MKKFLIAFVLVVGACGGGETTETVDDRASVTPTTAATVAASDDTQAPTTQPPATEAPEDEPAASAGAGGITLTIGDETWEFEGAGCAYQGAKPGEDGSEWNVSFVKDGAQVYVNDDSYGTFVQIADISNGGNPTFSWEAEGDAISVSVDGNDITAEGTFTDAATGLPDQEGTLTATCPGWVSG